MLYHLYTTGDLIRGMIMKHERRLNRQVVKEMATSIKDSIKEQADCGQSRSKKAALVELSLQLSGFKQMLHDPQKLHQELAKQADLARHPFALPSDVETQNGVIRKKIAGVPVVVLNANPFSDKIIIFLCGGAYFLQPTKDHWHFLQRLALQTNAQIMVPQYALSPEHHFEEAYDQLLAVYTAIYQEQPVSNITLMGDSAGGGLAAGFCEWLASQSLPQPRNLVLISPWLDLTLHNPLIAKYADKDATLDVTGLRTVGQLWAGTTELNDYRLSPINGPVNDLRNVLLFVGTREIMLPDVMKFVQRLRQADVHVEYHIGRELYHEYPLTPIPEAVTAIEQINRFCFQQK